MTNKPKFQSFKWRGLSTYLAETPHGQRVQYLMNSINWEALCQYASKIHNNESCIINPQVGLGGRHIVRRIEFHGGTQWVARIRIAAPENEDEGGCLLQREVDCLQLIKEQTSVPAPTVFGFVSNAKNNVGAPFMLMECLPGNTGLDLSGVAIPAPFKVPFDREMARFQTEISSINFPKIGAILRRNDGTYDVSALPGLGGPFDTATEYFQAWAKSTKFPESMDFVKERCEEGYEEIIAQIADFPSKIGELAAKLAIRDHGPFPLFHVDFGHHNIVVDDDYNVLGVVDWEYACSVPWERIYFPWTLSVVPAPMAPDNYNEKGMPKDPRVGAILREQKDYISTVRETEQNKGLSRLLSATLADQAGQDLAYAMKIYAEDGVCGLYTNVLDVHKDEWQGEKRLSDPDIDGDRAAVIGNT